MVLGNRARWHFKRATGTERHEIAPIEYEFRCGGLLHRGALLLIPTHAGVAEKGNTAPSRGLEAAVVVHALVPNFQRGVSGHRAVRTFTSRGKVLQQRV